MNNNPVKDNLTRQRIRQRIIRSSLVVGWIAVQLNKGEKVLVVGNSYHPIYIVERLKEFGLIAGYREVKNVLPDWTVYVDDVEVKYEPEKEVTIGFEYFVKPVEYDDVADAVSSYIRMRRDNNEK